MDDLRAGLDDLLDQYRTELVDRLDGLTEEEARRRLVPSKTTLLGLVKHLTYVEKVWFDQAITGRSYREIGIPATPDASFTLRRADTIASVRETFLGACDDSRRAAASLAQPAAPLRRR